MTGALVSGFISVEFASFNPSTFLEYSITADCIPRQIPKNGMLFSLKCLIVAIFPSIPLSPKPGATRTPFSPANFSAALVLLISSACIQFTFTLQLFLAPACIIASDIDL